MTQGGTIRKRNKTIDLETKRTIDAIKEEDEERLENENDIENNNIIVSLNDLNEM